MKKFSVLLLVFTTLFFVACGSSKKDVETTDTTPNGDTSSDTTSDNDNTDTADTDISDSGNSNSDDTDSDKTDSDNSDSESTPVETTPEGCQIFTVDNSTFSRYYIDTYLGYVKDNILGDRSMVDKLEIDIFQSRDATSSTEISSHPGTYDLGSGANKSAVDCTECVKVFQDHDGNHAKKLFFQESGTLVIEKVDADNDIKGTLTAKLVEVTIDPETREATPVENGECIAIENWAFDTGVCVPDCDGKVCGGDGCGGTCGDGCSGDLTCSKDQKSCVPFECEKITFDEVEMHINEYDTYYYKTKVSDNAIGSTELPDIMTLHFEQDGYVLKKGTIDLGGENAQYLTCVECIRLFEDMDFENNEYGRTFFQQSGELVFEEVKEGTFESKGHGSFRLVEVEIDDYTYESTPVPGGACYEVENLTWDTICVPQCKDKICGPDGCGGECGSGCGKDMACSADQKSCVKWNCEKITLEDLTENDVNIYPYDGIYNYMYPITPNIGDPEKTEILQLGLRGNIQEKRPYRLYGTNFRSSDVSFVLYKDGTDLYFQHSGTVTFDPFDSYTGVFEATLESIRLVKIALDEDMTSTIVPGGECVEITNETLEYKE